MNQTIHDHLMNIAHALDTLADRLGDGGYSRDVETTRKALNSFKAVWRYIDDNAEQEEVLREITKHRQDDL